MDLLVNLDVDDLDKAVRFYSAALDLKVGRRFGFSGVEMLGSSSTIYLLVKSSATQVSPTTTQQRNYQRHWTPILVDEIEPAVERAVIAGARLEQPIVTNNRGKLALMADPFGHGFCFVQFLGRGYDEVAE